MKYSIALVVLAALAACGGGQATSPAVVPPVDVALSYTRHPAHITVIVMENYAYSAIIGSSAAPYLNKTLLAHAALMTNSHAITHPSEPNYLALFSGSTHGLTTDPCPVTFSGGTLAKELRAKYKTFALYAESMPSANYMGCSYGGTMGYWRSHNPAADFAEYAGETHPLGTSLVLSADVTFIVPNQCHDMHSCPISWGDAWLKAHVPTIEAWDNANNGLLIVTFDEGNYSTTNQIVTIFDGPGIPVGRFGQHITHYDVLHAIEANFGLPYLGYSAYSSFTLAAI